MAEDQQQYQSDGQRFCSQCGNTLLSDATFCGNCGTPVAGDSVTEGVLAPSFEPMATYDGPEYMGFWIRFVAWILDWILVAVVGGVIGYAVGIPVLGTLLSVLYNVTFIGLKGQTLGKMALGIKVVDINGQPPGILKAVIREVIGKFVSAIALLLGYLWAAWDPRKRAWHDHIAGTYVIRKAPEPVL